MLGNFRGEFSNRQFGAEIRTELDPRTENWTLEAEPFFLQFFISLNRFPKPWLFRQKDRTPKPNLFLIFLISLRNQNPDTESYFQRFRSTLHSLINISWWKIIEVLTKGMQVTIRKSSVCYLCSLAFKRNVDWVHLSVYAESSQSISVKFPSQVLLLKRHINFGEDRWGTRVKLGWCPYAFRKKIMPEKVNRCAGEVQSL